MYRANAQYAYNHKRAVQWEQDKPETVKDVSIGVGRSKICCEGDVISLYCSMWQSNTPPLYFDCRSTLVAHYDEVEISEASPQSPTNDFGK